MRLHGLTANKMACVRQAVAARFSLKPSKCCAKFWSHFSKTRCAALLGVLLIGACDQPPEHLSAKVQGTTMGTSYTLTLACALDADDAREVVESVFARIDASMSTYRSDSELMRLNRTPPLTWLDISQDFARVVTVALQVAAFTQGAFDPTVGALVGLWGFGGAGGGGVDGSDARRSVPGDADIAPLLAASGWRQLEMHPDGARARRLSEFALDLSAIAKGYAVDLAIASLESKGCVDFLLEVGGEVGARGTRVDGSTWLLGIESPDSPGSVVLALALADAAIATSGDYRNRVIIDGEVFSHTLDPATGRPVSHGLASVSVIGESAMRSDALATALSVMGPDRGLAFAEAHEIEAYFITRVDSGYDSSATGRFRAAQTRPQH